MTKEIFYAVNVELNQYFGEPEFHHSIYKRPGLFNEKNIAAPHAWFPHLFVYVNVNDKWRANTIMPWMICSNLGYQSIPDIEVPDLETLEDVTNKIWEDYKKRYLTDRLTYKLESDFTR